jgi:hypothetical protein
VHVLRHHKVTLAHRHERPCSTRRAGGGSVRHGDVLHGCPRDRVGYHANAAGRVEPVLLSPRNDAAEAWSFGCTGRRCMPSAPRSIWAADCPAMMSVRWCIRLWTCSGAIPLWPGIDPYDSDPAGTAARPLARPFTEQDCGARGDRAWLAGSLALSTPQAWGGIAEPCSGARTHGRSGDGLTDSDQSLAPVALQFASPSRALDGMTVMPGITVR